ncbi:MAG TPA: IPT/TIG domain-containing protein [Acidimicrobiales bacterium]|nr:IPT/TIG domain-containing protein [Acidimicrobiales bacterium]
MTHDGHIIGVSSRQRSARHWLAVATLACTLVSLAVAGSVGVGPHAAGATTARLTAGVVPTVLTDPTGGNHGYRHGAVPRIVSSIPAPASASPRALPAIIAPAASTKLLTYGGGLTAGGLVDAGVTTGPPRVYLVFYGSQWGTKGTNGAGDATFSHDAAGLAPALQTLYAGLGTNGEQWSNIVTQYCDGVVVGATSCAGSSQRVPYPTGDVLAGVWYDASPTATNGAQAGATGHQLATEAEAAAVHFGHSDQTSNRNTQYVVVSPTGSNADGWNDPVNGYCAYHDDTHDASISGGGAVTGPIVAFTNMPYVPDAGAACGAGSVNSPGVLDGATEAASHEYAETLTDQFPEANPPGGWSTSAGKEIGDLCAYIAAPRPGASYDLPLATGSVAVQGLWSNGAKRGRGGCVQSSVPAPAIASVSPASGPRGSLVTVTGTGLSGATRVTINNKRSAIISDTATQIVVAVPARATSGPVAVRTPAGTAVSASAFTVT